MPRHYWGAERPNRHACEANKKAAREEQGSQEEEAEAKVQEEPSERATSEAASPCHATRPHTPGLSQSSSVAAAWPRLMDNQLGWFDP